MSTSEGRKIRKNLSILVIEMKFVGTPDAIWRMDGIILGALLASHLLCYWFLYFSQGFSNFLSPQNQHF